MPKETFIIPYIAKSFRSDAQSLLERFEELESLKFGKFAEIWRDLKFSLIYMGKWNLKTLREFTDECYRNTLMFMDLHRPYIKVGAVFLLYSLYVKQPLILLKTPVRIVLTLSNLAEITAVEKYFMESKHKESCSELNYVIQCLFKMEAFDISCSPIPMGPMVPTSILFLEPIRKSEFLNSLEDLKLVADTTVQDIISMMQKYEEVKKLLPLSSSNKLSDADLEKLKILTIDLEKYKRRYESGQCIKIVNNKHTSKDAASTSSVGRRRAMVKAKQFERPTGSGFRQSRSSRFVRSDIKEHIKTKPSCKRSRRNPKVNEDSNDKSLDESLGKLNEEDLEARETESTSRIKTDINAAVTRKVEEENEETVDDPLDDSDDDPHFSLDEKRKKARPKIRIKPKFCKLKENDDVCDLYGESDNDSDSPTDKTGPRTLCKRERPKRTHCYED